LNLAPSSRSSRPARGTGAFGRALALTVAAAIVIGGCAATTVEAPAGAAVSVGAGASLGASPGGISAGTSAGVDLDHQPRLAEGRTLYTARCQSCHALPAPGRLAPEAWPAEVRGMSRKSGLSTEQVKLISEYLTAASRAARPH
jgi:cytochrome c5